MLREQPERYSLSGYGPGLRVGVVDAFLDGLCQNSHVSWETETRTHTHTHN